MLVLPAVRPGKVRRRGRAHRTGAPPFWDVRQGDSTRRQEPKFGHGGLELRDKSRAECDRRKNLHHRRGLRRRRHDLARRKRSGENRHPGRDAGGQRFRCHDWRDNERRPGRQRLFEAWDRRDRARTQIQPSAGGRVQLREVGSCVGVCKAHLEGCETSREHGVDEGPMVQRVRVAHNSDQRRRLKPSRIEVRLHALEDSFVPRQEPFLSGDDTIGQGKHRRFLRRLDPTGFPPRDVIEPQPRRLADQHEPLAARDSLQLGADEQTAEKPDVSRCGDGGQHLPGPHLKQRR